MNAFQEHTGWLLDLYEDEQDGAILWMLTDKGERLRLHQPFPVTFYAHGPVERLRALCRFLKKQDVPLTLERVERRDIFSPQPLTVLAVQVRQTSAQPRLFQDAAAAFPDLTYFDADLALSLRYADRFNVFPLARCRLRTDGGGEVREITPLESPWEMDPLPAPLRTLAIEPDVNPSHAAPACLLLRSERWSYRLPLAHPRPLLVNLAAILKRHDPDLLLTYWGDTWLIPRLLELSKRCGLPLPLSRDPHRDHSYRPERSYFSYGQIIHRGQQYHLLGRWHIDCCNAMLFHDYGIEGVQELSRVTALPMQTTARVSPGSGISAMQILTALRQEVLVPWHKQQAERPKTALDLLRADQGGMVYQPITGLHFNVAAVDFISMYPSIMARFNISPETVGVHVEGARLVPQIGLPIDQERPGLIPQTLRPLLDKRLALKSRLGGMPRWDPRRKQYTARASAHKWLLVTCFGYLGYKNARFGRIEAHEAVTAYGREALLQAKEAAEDLGGEVLHLYVDGLWVKQEGAASPSDYQPLLDEIVSRTGLPVALDGIYRWVAFLPSRQNPNTPVANRYFGVFQDGSLKVRGIEARRGDTPPFIVQTQMEILERLAHLSSPDRLEDCLPGLAALLRKVISALRAGRIPMEKLLVSLKLSRELDEYRSPSPAARAAAQLAAAGKTLRPGQRVRFILTHGEPGVFAWDLPGSPDPASIDTARYIELLLRAASTVLQPFGFEESGLKSWILNNASAPSLPLPLSLPRTVQQQVLYPH
jgi:DNA polymerase II